MKKFLIPFILLFSSVLYGQDYRPYAEISNNIENGNFKPGVYYVLVSTDWCQPCLTLKDELKNFPNTTIYYINGDSRSQADRQAMKQLMPLGNRYPHFIKYEATGQITTKYKYDNWMYPNLNLFITDAVKNKVEIPTVTLNSQDVIENYSSRIVPDEAIEDENPIPIEVLEVEEEEKLVPLSSLTGNLFDRFRDLEESTNEKIEGLLFDREGILNKLSELVKTHRENYQNLITRNESLKDEITSLGWRLRDLKFDSGPLFSKLAEASTERKTIIQSLRDFGKDRTTLIGEIRQFRSEREGILSQLRETREERTGLFSKLAEAAREREGLLSRLRDQERQFKPLQNLVDRLNGLFIKITSSIWIIIGLIISALIGLMIVLSIVIWMFSMFKKIIKFILPKVGLGALIP